MILFPAEYNARKEAVFAALAAVDGSARRLPMIPLSLRDHAETPTRVAKALHRAKRQPGNALLRWLKRQLIRGQYNWARRYFTRHPDHIALAWNGLTGSRMAFMLAAKDAGAPTLYAELAPLPGRITLDPAGVNAEGSVPQDPAFFRDWAQTHGTQGWRDIGAGLTARASRRADVGQSDAPLPETPFLFCPLQVPDDSQVTLFAGWCGGMSGFLAALAQAAQRLPEGWHLRLKEHPSAKTPLAPLLAPLLASGRVVLDNASDSFAQIAAARGVVTLNSSMGVQAFFHDRPVITLGRAFFALPGLVQVADSQTTLDTLFADPAGLHYDEPLRAAFLTWLDRVYYPRFSHAAGQPAAFDRDAFAAKLDQARAMARLRAETLSPRPPLR
ncbi:capsular biosynthesis protein [Gemmobacter fulvus]|uniref:capsular polysaccharide export protein, LipB/KpsS family n=1 Tax=Gemmobacter fulvus TaxID=2840474 RepID=UPI002796C6D8|nr:capsular biosynthesis protein [Gemmobacter fulvus]MDQ1850015.1 capsular biosynthesis protein [Gemmobacter fulvus]